MIIQRFAWFVTVAIIDNFCQVPHGPASCLPGHSCDRPNAVSSPQCISAPSLPGPQCPDTPRPAKLHGLRPLRFLDWLLRREAPA